MRASVILSAIFATAAIAAPILDGTISAVEDKATSLVDDLETTVGHVTEGVLRRDDIENDVPAGDVDKRLLSLSGLLGTVDGLLNDVLGKVGQLESTIGSIVTDVENLDVEGVLSEVEGLVNDVLSEVQDVASQAGVDLDLSELNPLLAIVTAQVQGLLDTVNGVVASQPAVAALISEVQGTLANALAILGGISL